MADLAAISAALTSVKAAMDLAKLLRGADLSLERAEEEMKLVTEKTAHFASSATTSWVC